jgi:hypothetical protein
MRRFILASTMALGLVTLWALILPLVAARQLSTTPSPAMSKALFHCHRQQGIDQACIAALARTLVIEQPERATRACPANLRTLPKKQEVRP